ncbi:MAG: hypothetical protein H6832_01170 [Planctomycetes bacterium]|nr:hypothetical protein [Planctomycetota bacterium]MCB9916995.1 hypothetical protein [Planctomycetota bacterium]
MKSASSLPPWPVMTLVVWFWTFVAVFGMRDAYAQPRSVQQENAEAPSGRGHEVYRVMGDVVVFDFGDEHDFDLTEFVELAKAVTHKSFYFDKQQDPRLLQKPGIRIPLSGTFRVKTKQFYEFFQVVLAKLDWVCVPSGADGWEFIDLVYVNGPRGPSIRSGVRWVANDEVTAYAHQEGTYIVTTIDTSPQSAQLIAANLRQFFHDQKGLMSLVPAGGDNQTKLMITGTGSMVNTVVAVVKSFQRTKAEPADTDRPGSVEAQEEPERANPPAGADDAAEEPEARPRRRTRRVRTMSEVRKTSAHKDAHEEPSAVCSSPRPDGRYMDRERVCATRWRF